MDCEIFESALKYKNRPFPLLVKRVFDLVFTIPGIVLLLPLMLLITIFIKTDSPGPAIFKQKRVGKNGRIFEIYKFRSMAAGTEKLGKYFTAENDKNITRVGKVLRKLKLDELPQLFNVLKGEMSLVGPRPMIPEIVSHYPTVIKDVVLSVKPGITDFASIAYIEEGKLLEVAQNPGKLYIQIIIPAKLRFYAQYVQTHNIWLDFKIVLLTIIYLLKLFLCIIMKTEHRKFSLKVKHWLG
ncbi:MAG: sugar transferase [Bacillota bacterium]